MALCILKTFERMVNTRLIYWLENNGFYVEPRFGFRKGNSCVDNLSILATEIHETFYRKESLAGLFVDVNKSAFNGVIPDILIDDLISTGLPINSCYSVHTKFNLRTHLHSPEF